MHPLHPSARTTHHMLATRDARLRHMPPPGQNGAVVLHAEAPSHRICSAITTIPPLRTAQPATLPQMCPHAKGSQALLLPRPPQSVDPGQTVTLQAASHRSTSAPPPPQRRSQRRSVGAHPWEENWLVGYTRIQDMCRCYQPWTCAPSTQLAKRYGQLYRKEAQQLEWCKVGPLQRMKWRVPH